MGVGLGGSDRAVKGEGEGKIFKLKVYLYYIASSLPIKLTFSHLAPPQTALGSIPPPKPDCADQGPRAAQAGAAEGGAGCARGESVIYSGETEGRF